MTPEQETILKAVGEMVKQSRLNGAAPHFNHFLEMPAPIVNEIKNQIDMTKINECIAKTNAILETQNAGFVMAVEKIVNFMEKALEMMGTIANRPVEVNPVIQVQPSPAPNVNVGQPSVTVQPPSESLLLLLAEAMEKFSQRRSLMIDHGDGTTSTVHEV